MKKAAERFIILLMILMLILSSAYAQEAAPSDQNGVEKIICTYKSLAVTHPVSFMAPYSDAWFSEDAKVFNRELAKSSLGLTVCAFADSDADAAHTDRRVISFLQDADFECIRTYQYDVPSSKDTVASVLAYKKMDGFTLIATPVRGQGYGNEWLSNFDVGDEVRHKGFSDSALKVEQRIQDYIEENRIEGPIKLWCTGFSRAAAVSNLVAADMVDSGLFADVFAYTFATPRTTREPGDYPNIFNIVGKFDPVPAIPISDWGYKRNGIDLFTPAQETDSAYQMLRQMADVANRALNDKRFRNNPSLNGDLHMLIEYLLEMLPTSQVYMEVLEPALRDVWMDHSSENILEMLTLALKELNNLPEKDQDLVSELINFIYSTIYARTAGGNKTELKQGYWDAKGMLVDNVMHEHTPDVYVSWLYSEIPNEELFSADGSVMRMCIHGDVLIDIYDEYGFIQRIDAEGNISTEPTEDIISLRQVGETPKIHAVRQGTQTIITFPRDRSYLAALTSLKNQEIEYFGTVYSTDSIRGEVTKRYSLNMEPDQIFLVVSYGEEDSAQAETDVIEGLGLNDEQAMSSDAIYSPSFILAMERANVLQIELSTLMVVVPAIVGFVIIVVVMTIIFAVMRMIRKRKRNTGMTIVTHATVAMLCFLLEEGARYYILGYPIVMTVLKGLTSLTIALLCLKGVRRKRRAADRFVCFALFVCGFADVLMNRNMTVATLLYGIAHILLIVGYVNEKTPKPWQYIVGIVLSVVYTAAIIIFRGKSPISPVFLIGYAIILSAMIASSLRMRPGLIVGTIGFAISVLLMSRNMVQGETFIRHFISLGVFYISQLIMASTVWIGKVEEEEAKVKARKRRRILAFLRKIKGEQKDA